MFSLHFIFSLSLSPTFVIHCDIPSFAVHSVSYAKIVHNASLQKTYHLQKSDQEPLRKVVDLNVFIPLDFFSEVWFLVSICVIYRGVVSVGAFRRAFRA